LHRNRALDNATQTAGGVPGVASQDASIYFLTTEGTVGAGRELRIAFIPCDAIAIVVATFAFEVVVEFETVDELVPDIEGLNGSTGEAVAATRRIARGTGNNADIEDVTWLITVEAGVEGIQAMLKGLITANIIAIGTVKIAGLVQAGTQVVGQNRSLRGAGRKTILLTEQVALGTVAVAAVHLPTFQAHGGHTFKSFTFGLEWSALRTGTGAALATKTICPTNLLSAQVRRGEGLANEVIWQASLKCGTALRNWSCIAAIATAGIISAKLVQAVRRAASTIEADIVYRALSATALAAIRSTNLIRAVRDTDAESFLADILRTGTLTAKVAATIIATFDSVTLRRAAGTSEANIPLLTTPAEIAAAVITAFQPCTRGNASANAFQALFLLPCTGSADIVAAVSSAILVSASWLADTSSCNTLVLHARTLPTGAVATVGTALHSCAFGLADTGPIHAEHLLAATEAAAPTTPIVAAGDSLAVGLANT
jgi:hypothetical protein